MKLNHYLTRFLVTFVSILTFMLVPKLSYAGAQKIDSEGRFLEFPGISVVADIGAEDKELWLRVYNSLRNSQLITQYFSLLPPNSYHMTTIDLYIKNEDPYWSEFVSDYLPWFQSLSAGLQTHAFRPHVVPKAYHVSGVIQFIFDLDITQHQNILQVARGYKIPMEKVTKYSHVTLAYGYKSIPNGILNQIQKDVEYIFQSTMKTYHKPIVFDEPKLRYFHNMTEFVPWEGKENPFINKK